MPRLWHHLTKSEFEPSLLLNHFAILLIVNHYIKICVSHLIALKFLLHIYVCLHNILFNFTFLLAILKRHHRDVKKCDNIQVYAFWMFQITICEHCWHPQGRIKLPVQRWAVVCVTSKEYSSVWELNKS